MGRKVSEIDEWNELIWTTAVKISYQFYDFIKLSFERSKC